MKNVDGEEINEDLFLKKANKKLNELQLFMENEEISELIQENILKLVAEYSMIMHLYGSFIELMKQQ